MDHSRDPCPWVALSDFGGAFCMGVSLLCTLLQHISSCPSNLSLGPLIENQIVFRESEVQYGTVSKATETHPTVNVESAPSQPSKLVRQYWGAISGYGEACSQRLTVRSRGFGRRKILGMLVCVLPVESTK